MLFNLLKTTIRNFSKFKIHSFINLISLSLGILVIVLISAFVKYETSFDQFYKDKDNIYRLEADNDRSLTFPAPLYGLLKNNFPEIKNISRVGFVFADWMLGGNGTFTYNENTFSADEVLCADPEFFDIFQFKAINGNLTQALTAPMSIVLTESEAKRIFGDENPVGKTLVGNEVIPINVTAVVEDVPSNSSLQFKSIISFPSLNVFFDRNIDNNWGSWNYLMYAQLNEGADIGSLGDKITEIAQPNMPVEHIGLYALNDIYLNAPQTLGVIKKGNKQQIVLFISVALVVLLIGLINYINLTNAKFIYRIKEIGIRKIIGAQEKHIIYQIMVEAVATLLAAMIISLTLIFIFTQQIGNFLNIAGIGELIFDFTFIASLILGVCILGLFTGLYPSYYLLKRANLSIKKNMLANSNKHAIQNSLVVFQFLVSIILITSIFFIHKQMNYINNRDIGFDKESIVQFSLPNNLSNEQFNSLKQSLLSYPDIIDVGRSNTTPGKSFPEWTWTMNLNGEKKSVTFLCITVDEEFINSLGLKLVSGRDFNQNSAEDIGDFIINEKFFTEYEVDPTLTATLSAATNGYNILGVVKDFNPESLHMPVQPLAFRYVPQNTSLGIVRFSATGRKDISGIVQHLKSVWNEMGYKKSLDYVFLEDSIGNLYNKERRLQSLLIVFGLFALVVSLAGLWGLTMLSIKLRVKEIGIRKVNGAKVSEILAMLNKDFVKWVVIAFIIATPVAWYAMNKWLENFAYKTNLSWWIFALAGLLALGIALLTVSWQSWRAATRNPVEALRYE